MAKANNPPRRSGALKLSPVYTAMIGQPRTCTACGETKLISFATFAPRAKSPDAVSPVCRICQGGAAREKQLNPPDPTRFTWNFEKQNRKAYWDHVTGLTDALYELASDVKRKSQFDAVCRKLNEATRLPTDRAGGGLQNDSQLAFRTFVKVLERLIANWLPFGEIHDSDLLPAICDEASDQSLILASRNSGKSALCELYCSWLLHRDPLRIVGVVSGSTRRAKRTLRAVRNYLELCPLLWPLRPTEECLDSSEQFCTPQANGRLGASVSFSSFGVTSNLTGFRFDIALLDDLEGEGDKSTTAQDTLEAFAAEIWNLLNPDARLLCIGTPHADSGLSLYARWAKSGEFKVTKALLFEELPQDHGRGQKSQLRSRWAARWTDEALEAKRRRVPARVWSLSWKLDFGTADVDNRPLKLRELITVKWPVTRADFPSLIRGGGERLSYLNTGMADPDDYFRGTTSMSKETSNYAVTLGAVDPASGIIGRDEVGVCVVSVTMTGFAVVRCLTGVRGESAPDALKRTASLLHSFFPNKIVVEARADSLYPSQLQAALALRGYPVMVEGVFSGANKGLRILDAVGVPVAAGRVIMLEDVVSGDDALETIKQYTQASADARKLRHDDRIDALAHALAAVANQLLIEENEGLQTKAEATIERLLRTPIRKGGITENGLEMALLEKTDDEMRLEHRLNQCLEIQADEMRRGIVDPRYDQYIQAMREDLTKLRRWRTPSLTHTLSEERNHVR
jgi:hypothetical protein